MNAMITAAIVFFVAVILRALFAGYETGFVSLNPIRIRFLAEEDNMPRAIRLLDYATNRTDQMLTMLLIGTNICTIVGTMAITRAALDNLGVYGEAAAAAIVTPLFLVFTEIIPKSVFRTHPNRLSLALLPVIGFFYYLLSPLVLPVAWMTRLFLRTPGGEKQYLSPLMVTREDVRVLVDESAHHGTIEPLEQQMIHRVIGLQGKQANEIMVPRIDIQALPDTATRAELAALLERSGCSRIPIYHETIDSVIGVVSAHDVLLDTGSSEDTVARLVRDVIHVPDTIKVDDLLQLLKSSKQHIAIVTDEYGGTDGLITIEDVLEEIFGEIQDEHDREESLIAQVGPGAYVVDARTPLNDLARALNATIQDDEVETVGGWIMHTAGRIPAQGEVVKHGPFRITVLEGGPNHIAKIRIETRGDKALDSPRA